MVLLGVAAVLGVVVLASIIRAGRLPRSCHYCGRAQPPRQLQRIDLTGAGLVDVCADARSCRAQHLRDLAR